MVGTDVEGTVTEAIAVGIQIAWKIYNNNNLHNDSLCEME